ncbi:hypothetical protein [Brevundimonas lutea]|uniref:hypothetical protein n=1 Tax=Brevundimonas lutea TaxID=2293980 RepID=UPI0013CED804|nr:hypothetical protein [Brevundimonas lutea]
MTMGAFQLRYQGREAPDPETLTAVDVMEALALARLKVLAAGDVPACLWVDGAVVHVFRPGDDEAAAPNVEQLMAAAGVYVFTSPPSLPSRGASNGWGSPRPL